MRISVDGSRIRNNKVAFSNLSGMVRMGPYAQLKQRLHKFFVAAPSDSSSRPRNGF